MWILLVEAAAAVAAVLLAGSTIGCARTGLDVEKSKETPDEKPAPCDPQQASSYTLVSANQEEPLGYFKTVEDNSYCFGASSNRDGKMVAFSCGNVFNGIWKNRTVHVRNLSKDQNGNFITDTSEKIAEGSGFAQITQEGNEIVFQRFDVSAQTPEQTGGEIILRDLLTKEELNISLDEKHTSFFPTVTSNGKGEHLIAYNRGKPAQIWMAKVGLIGGKKQVFGNQLLVKNSKGEAPNGFTLYPKFSPDGEWITFLSNATNLTDEALDAGPVRPFAINVKTNEIIKVDETELTPETNDPDFYSDYSKVPQSSWDLAAVSSWESLEPGKFKTSVSFPEKGETLSIDTEFGNFGTGQGLLSPWTTAENGIMAYYLPDASQPNILYARTLNDSTEIRITPDGLETMMTEFTFSADFKSAVFSGAVIGTHTATNVILYQNICK